MRIVSSLASTLFAARGLLLVVLVVMGWPSAIAADSNVCPANLSSKHSVAGYKFELQSWSWASKEVADNQTYCHCVRNKSEGGVLWVDWKETGLAAFVAPQDVIYSYFSSPNGLEERRMVPFWYGAGPTRIDVETVFNRINSVPSRANPPADAASAGSAPKYSASKNSNALVSSSVVYLPNMEAIENMIGRPGLSMKEIVSVVEKNPKFLVAMEMQFESTPTFDSSNKWVALTNSCSYKVDRHGSPMDGKNGYRMRLADQDLHRDVFHKSSAQEFESWSGRRNVFSGVTKITAASSDNMKRSVTEVEIMPLKSNIVVARIPVAYFQPSSEIRVSTR